MYRSILASLFSACILLFFVLILGPEALSFFGRKDSTDAIQPSKAPLSASAVKVPGALIAIGPPSGYAIVVEKDTQQLFLFGHDKGFREIFRLKASTGEVRGAKTRSGDSKTPEGIYFFTKEYLDKDLAPIYGSRAFPMDYPNLLDKIAGHTGNSIWLHGSQGALKPRSSNGCVALENMDIEKLSEYITLNRTPIIVVKKMSFMDEGGVKQAQKTILNFLAQWKQSLETGTYHEYLTHYDAEYVPDISWWGQWLNKRKRFKEANSHYAVELNRPSIFQHDNTFVVLFDQVANAVNQNIQAGTRKLYIRKRPAGLKIVGEEYQALPEDMQKKDRGNPLVLAYRRLEKFIEKPIVKPAKPKVTPDDHKEIRRMVDAWLKAWEAKDIEKYGEFYAKDFNSQGRSLKMWLKYKATLNQRYAYIRVSKEDQLKIKKYEDKRMVTFRQAYESSGHKAVGVKRIVLKREDGKWKIYREMWEKI